MADRWQCTPGTVQQAYRELVRHGLVVSRPGQGTRVAAALHSESPMRRASLVHQAEAFLLDTLAAGYTALDVERALRIALDRWRALVAEPPAEPSTVLRCAGSHDPAASLIAGHFADVLPGAAIQVTFSGSLGGLIALAVSEADIAGSHLWDETCDCYNVPFVGWLLPRQACRAADAGASLPGAAGGIRQSPRSRRHRRHGSARLALCQPTARRRDPSLT